MSGAEDLYAKFYVRAEIDPQHLGIKPDELKMDVNPEPVMSPIAEPAKRRIRNWLR